LPRLENPVSDAQLIASTLHSDGFQLIGGQAQTDLDRAGFERVIRQFGRELSGGSVGLFYYAGHGVQIRDENFLVPVEADPATAADADFELIDANSVLKQMELADLKLVILDACRNNPFGGRGLRDAGGGLAQMQAPHGTLISYATQPGHVAQDGKAEHSPYTAALADMMLRPGLAVLDVFNEVGLAVDQATGGRQVPWTSNSPLEGVFYFLGPTTVNITPPAPAQPSPDPETVFWQSIGQSTNAADFDEYLRQYPQGRFAGLAHNRLAALRPPPPAQVPTLQRHDGAPVPPSQQPSSDQHEIARQLQTELQRVGCFSGKINGIWDSRSGDAVKRFNQHAHMILSAEPPSPESLAAVHASTARVCPLTCPRGETPAGDHCVVIQPRLASPTRESQPAIPTASPRPAVPLPPSSTQGKRCTNSLGIVYCE
jgi:hypothetical protein